MSAIPRKPRIPRPPILDHRTDCLHNGPYHHTTIHVDQRQYRRTTMGGRTKMLLHGQPLCQSGNNATLHKGARMVPPVHKPGIEMGDIDTMSRLAAHENPTAKEIQQRCPTLTPSTMLTLPQEQLQKLFLLLDPHLTHPSTHDHHDAFIQVHRALNELFDALSP
jgi:hypothetical protein